MTSALIYTRVSQDRAGGRSPAEQEADARALCVERGWQVAEVITDTNGASRHSKGRRDGWDRVRGLLAGGTVDVLVTWEASRAQRDLAVYTELRGLCAANGVMWAYDGKVFDLADSDDRFRTGQDALMAEREADEASKRIRRATRANAVAGRPHGRRLFGYQRTYDPETGRLIGQEPHPVEADVVRRIYTDYLAGDGVRTIARALNDEGTTTGTGASWNDGQVRRVLTNPAYVARRVHQGQVVGDADWPPLVDPDAFDRVQARLDDQRGVPQHRVARLLTGVVRCGVCGGKMAVGKAMNGRRFYQCRTPGRFCVARDLTKLDAFVTVVVLERLARPDVADALAGSPDPAVTDARQRVTELRARLDDATAQFVDGQLTAATLARVEHDLTERIAQAERDARAALVPIDLDVPTDVDGWWDTLDPSRRRAVVGALIAAVVVKPVGAGRRTFDPTAISIEWRR